MQSLWIFLFLSEYYLAGGTNLALRYNHRTSIDLNLFVHGEMEQDSSNYLSLKLREIFGDRFESNNITKVGVFGFIDKIKVDFVNYPYRLLQDIDIMEGARLAHPLDIGGMKVNAIVGRGSRKDFFDLHRLLEVYPLTEIMDNYQKKYGLDNIQQAKMSLVILSMRRTQNTGTIGSLPLSRFPGTGSRPT